jgi:hypothetical protein
LGKESFSLTAAEQRGKNLKGFKDVYLKAKARNLILALAVLNVPSLFDSAPPPSGYSI